MPNEMIDAYERWTKSKSDDDFRQVLETSRPVLDSAITSYVGSKDPVAYSHARILASRAIKSYDKAKGTQLRTHLLTQLQPLRRLAAQRRFVAHIPEQMQYDASGLREAESSLHEELGRDPSEQEIADRAGLSVKRIRAIRGIAIPTPESKVVGEEGEPLDIAMKGADPMVEDWVSYVYHDLGPVDRKIYEWRTGHGGSPVLGVSEIARKLGITPGAVTQRANAIVAKIQQGMTRAR